MKIAHSTALHFFAAASSIVTTRLVAALMFPFQSSIKYFRSKKAMVLTRNQFAQFAHPADKEDSDAPSASRSPDHSRWTRVISPSPVRKRKAAEDGSSDASPASTPSKSSPKKKAKSSTAPLTESFSAVTAANFTKNKNDIPPVHTLLLGTHPSIKSREKSQYYGHSMNAFWWIAGDCLGFRRADGLKKNGRDYFGFVEHLKYDESHIIPYEKQVEKMCMSGFALWDTLKECKRPGSLDQDITDEIPNDIRGFCQLHPSIKRIVFSNGGTGCSFFKKHFKDWLDSGELVPSKHKASQDAFKKWIKNKPPTPKGKTPIECIVALPVSPAAAKFTYEKKRDFWKEYVYKPGLKDFVEANSTANDR